LVWDIAAGVRTLAQGSPAGIAGLNDFSRPGYGGPCPPPTRNHRYYFRLYALGVEKLGLPAGSRRAEFDAAIAGKMLSEAACMGRFER
jgi:phosphatidylethanolamine-binding protein (PEBP) family uncharacterized protein